MNKTTGGNGQSTVFSILFAISLVHLLNDSMQSAVTAIFPIIYESLHLSFSQIGWIGFTQNVTASLLQPLVGLYTDSRPMPYILPVGVAFSLVGIAFLAIAGSFVQVLLAVALIGIGSSVLHPESSRVAYLAAGPRRGLAQSIFQTGGNIGQSLAPILTALIFVPLGQFGVIWFTLAAAAGIVVQMVVARWYREQLNLRALPRLRPRGDGGQAKRQDISKRGSVGHGVIVYSMILLVLLIFSKTVYTASMTGFYPFYLIEYFDMTISQAQLYVFALLVAGVLGTFFGGPLADRFGRRNMIWFSILGAAPFSILLPYADRFWAYVLCVLVGFIILSGFSVIVVYAQELLPGKVGMVSGLFFGLAFGLGGVGSALLGNLADRTSIGFIIHLTAFLPLMGLLAAFLPSDQRLRQAADIGTTDAPTPAETS